MFMLVKQQKFTVQKVMVQTVTVQTVTVTLTALTAWGCSEPNESKTTDPMDTVAQPEGAGGAIGDDDPQNVGGNGGETPAPEPSNVGGGPMPDTSPNSAGGQSPVDPAPGPSAPDGGEPSAPADQVALPEGWREADGLLNLVDATAAAEVRDYVTNFSDESAEITLSYSASLFYEVYADEYDFLFFLPDEELVGGGVAAFMPVRQPVIVGTGLNTPFIDPAYSFSSRLKGVIGADYPGPNSMPPLAHELVHYWANHLDKSFGFGLEIDTDWGSHWGLASVNGQLGGFDAQKLRCETPADAVPPDCTPEASGRTRYVTGAFAPHTNSFRGADYAPLELYLMGLLPLSEVPQSYLVFEDGKLDPGSIDREQDRAVVEASGLREVLLSDIVALHGERPLLPEGERAYTSAFIIVGEQPASDEFIAGVNEWVQIFGNQRESNSSWKSFEATASSLATLNTRLGRRRGVDEPVAEPTPAQPNDVFTACDLLAQDCDGNGACIATEDEPYCIVPGDTPDGEACFSLDDCRRGSACQYDYTTEDEFKCTPYCDPHDALAQNACTLLCPNDFITMSDPETFEETAAYCVPGAGGACDPLLQNCDPDQGCYGRETPGCAVAGVTPMGESCAPLGTPCVAGTECIGVEGGSTACMPYCALDGQGEAAESCGTICQAGVFVFDGFGICIPPQ